jgi:hypothetical protein
MLKSEAKHWMDRMRVVMENGKREGNKYANRAGHTLCRKFNTWAQLLFSCFGQQPLRLQNGKEDGAQNDEKGDEDAALQLGEWKNVEQRDMRRKR